MTGVQTCALPISDSYGALEDVPAARIRDVISQMASDGYLRIRDGKYPLVDYGERAAETARTDFHMVIKQVERPVSGGGPASDGASRGTRSAAPAELSDADTELFERLRGLRTEIAREIGKPPYIVFSDKSLRGMCELKPTDDAGFLAVNGVGQHKLELYGERFLAVIREFAGADFGGDGR